MSAAGSSFITAFLIKLVVLLTGGGLLGMPPGARDESLIRCAGKDVLVYVEWSERSSGQPGAPGIDGLVADPEVRAFADDFFRAIATGVSPQPQPIGSNQPDAAQTIAEFARRALNCSGCFVLSFDPAAAEAEATPGGVTRPWWHELARGSKAVLVLNAGANADTFQELVLKLLKLTTAESEIRDLKNRDVPLPWPELKLTLHRHENYFVLGLGQGAVETAVAGLSGQSQGLTANERFARAFRRVAAERVARLAWLDVKGINDVLAANLDGPGVWFGETIRAVGADAIDSIAITTSVEEGRIRTRQFINTGGRTGGILSLAAGRAVQPKDWEHVPADADFVCALSLSAPQILTALKRVVHQADPKSLIAFEQLIEEWEIVVGVSLEGELLKVFGDTLVFHDAPSSGGLLVSGLTGSLEVRDPATASVVFSKLMTTLADKLPGELFGSKPGRSAVVLAKQEFLRHSIYYVNSFGVDVPFAPAFCLTNKRLFFAPHPQAIKAQLRFLASAEPNITQRLSGFEKSPAHEVVFLSFWDTPALARSLYAVVPYFGQLLAGRIQSHGGMIDVFAVPSARAVLPYVTDSMTKVSRAPDGIHVDSRGSLPIPLGWLPFGVMARSFDVPFRTE